MLNEIWTFVSGCGTSRQRRAVTINSSEHNSGEAVRLKVHFKVHRQPGWGWVWLGVLSAPTGSVWGSSSSGGGGGVVVTYRYGVGGASVDVEGWRVVVGDAGSGQGGRGSEAHCVAAVRQT